MPISNYSVLKGQPTGGKVVRGTGTHYQIDIQAAGASFTVAVNIESFDGSEVLYRIEHAFAPPDTAGLLGLAEGVTRVPSQPGGLALDYVRQRTGGQPTITRAAMTLLPVGGAIGHASGQHLSDEERREQSAQAHALQDAVVALIEAAIAAGNAILYAFGSAYSDAGQVDGIHDIHMNQGNPAQGGHAGDNGIWQDGALFLQLPGKAGDLAMWTAVFIAFQTESWTTDAQGNPQ